MGDGKCVSEILSTGKSVARQDIVVMVCNPCNDGGERIGEMLIE